MLSQRLYELDRTSTGFPKQLDELLHDSKWVADLQRLPEGELAKLIGHLNNVRSILTPTKSHSPPRRFLIVSSTQTRTSESASMCCRNSAAQGRFSPQPTRCLARFHFAPRSRSHTADFVTSIEGPSVRRMFPSNGSGYPPQAIGRWLNRYLIPTIFGWTVTP